jgi:hypothetical protein
MRERSQQRHRSKWRIKATAAGESARQRADIIADIHEDLDDTE